MTTSQVISQLRAITKDYNFWDQIERDSPLTIGRTLAFDPLKLHARLLRKSGLDLTTQTIVGTTYNIDEVFAPLIENSYAMLKEVWSGQTTVDYEQIEQYVEPLEYFIQLRNTFSKLNSFSANYISSEGLSYTGLIIGGRVGADEYVYLGTLLIQQT